MIGGLAVQLDPRDLRVEPTEPIGEFNDHWAELHEISKPRDQDGVACCVSAAVVSCFEIFDYYNNYETIPFSPLFNYYYARLPSRRRKPTQEILIQDGFAAVKSHGLCAANRHAPQITPGNSSLRPSPQSLRDEAKLYTGRFRRPGDLRLKYRSLTGADRLDRLKAIITARAALVLGIWITDAYARLRREEGEDARDTHERPTERGASQHAVCCVGYDDRHRNPDGLEAGAIHMKDSRGTKDFGDGGYWWLPYGLFDQLVTECWFLRYEEEDD